MRKASAMSASANNPEPPPEGGACDQKAALQPIASAYSTDPFQNSVQESKEEVAFTADARLLDESAEELAPALVGGGGTAGVQELSAETPPPPPPPPPSVEGAPALPPPDALAVGGEGIDRPAVQVLSAAPALPDDCGDGGEEDESLTLEGMLQEAKVQKQKEADIRERVDLEVEAVMENGVRIHSALRAMVEGGGSEGASAAQAPASTQSSPIVHEVQGCNARCEHSCTTCEWDECIIVQSHNNGGSFTLRLVGEEDNLPHAVISRHVRQKGQQAQSKRARRSVS